MYNVLVRPGDFRMCNLTLHLSLIHVISAELSLYSDQQHNDSGSCVASHQGEEVILQTQTVHGQQWEVSDTRQQTLQHGGAVLDPVESHSSWINLQMDDDKHGSDTCRLLFHTLLKFFIVIGWFNSINLIAQ